MFKTIVFACLTVFVSAEGTRLNDLNKSAVKTAVTPAAQTNILTGDFLTGFESGIFLREKEDQIKEYGCPKAEV
jgi:hypothetical protein